MRRGVKLIPVTFLLVQILIGLSAFTASAKQSFTDEAGELIYMIDDNGMVSMFENSQGTDITLSVTRGTREEMQPRITELTPESVQAGSHNVLRMTGRNLVGAKVKLSVPGIEVGVYSGKPKKLDVPINVPMSVPRGPVIVEVTTPIGVTTTSFQVAEVQIGSSEPRPDVITHPGMGYGADEGARSIPTTAPTSCPQGMVGVASEAGGFCIELDHTFSGDFRKADQACALTGKRLCMLSEWRKACEQTAAGKAPLKSMKGQWEWTGGFDILHDDSQQDTRYYVMGKSDCEFERGTMRLDAEKFPGRCCK